MPKSKPLLISWRVGENKAPLGPFGSTYRSLFEHDRPVTFDVQVQGAEPVAGKNVLLLAGMGKEGQELWAVRLLPSGRLVLQLGTAGHRETIDAYYPDFQLGLSYNPQTGGVALAAGGIDLGPVETLTGTARCAWTQPNPEDGEWELWIGCPGDGRADVPPVGWTISASYRYGEALLGDHFDPNLLSVGEGLALADESLHGVLDAAAQEGAPFGAQVIWRGNSAEALRERLLARTLGLYREEGGGPLLPSRQIAALAQAVAEELAEIHRGLPGGGA